MSDTSIRNEAPIGPDYTAVAVGAVHKLSVVTPHAEVNGHGAVNICSGIFAGQPTGFALNAAPDGGQVQVDAKKPVSGTTDEWDARTGQTGGLTAGNLYYVDQTTGGNITNVQPGSGLAKVVGVALNAVTMLPLGVLPFTVVG